MMGTPVAQRMKAMRARRRSEGLRELRLVVPDARANSIRQRVAEEVGRLSPTNERDALDWIESIAEFDETR